MSGPNVTPFDFRAQRPFNVTPDDLLWRMRENWIGAVYEGHPVMLPTLIPYLEMEAASRLSKESSVFYEDCPKLSDGYEGWLLYWVNEASHNCDSHSPIGTAGQHLSAIGQSAVNIIMTAAALRDALESSNAELSSVLSITLICEAIQGGYSLEVEAMRTAQDAIEIARKDRVRNTIGKTHDDLEVARKACIDKAMLMWSADPTMLIGAVAKDCKEGLLRNIHKLPTLTAQDIPEVETIKGWFRDAAAAGKLAIPAAAQKRGRPPKSAGK